jgi:hypothetical protein
LKLKPKDMTPTLTAHKDHTQTLSDDISRVIINHRKIAVHLQTAARLHLEAARHFEKGDMGKASQYTSMAQEHTALALKNGLTGIRAEKQVR